ncbi:polymorphic toxin type 44 domain-containing protein [Paenibacillus timonensis]|uniref:Polymorphic toxin type 44 domain-containing protein n=1 Tax=Paenibacillus timonensis TaxID=225915 RepID=A0ABW3SDW9_9BACL|nr:polymorphic toxin type 44 domain-containing protein [Paenibacillus timonensis]MCH1641388.1 polymorphic toxin type 44 domain-containing protein [Paenibacillus timonensis]
MKKVYVLILAISLFFCSFAGLTSANSQTDLELTAEQYQEIHTKVVENNYVSLTNDGQIVISATAESIDIDPYLFNEYLANINTINHAIRSGGVKFDSNYNLQIAPVDEIAQIVYERDQQKKKELNNSIVPFSDPGAPPVLQAYTIARNNYLEMEQIWNSLALGIGGNASAATTYVLGFWVGKVKPGGAWDYKAVSGYTPYNKEWQARVRNGTEIRTSEWFGNYNYGFTGKFLFSLSILYTGGDVVSQITGGAPDDFSDKAAIAQGYNENY